MMTFIIGFPVVMIILVLAMGIVHTLEKKSESRKMGINTGYMSDQEYLENGGVIRYHHYGRTRE